MKPYNRNGGKIFPRNKNKINSISDKDRKNSYLVGNKTGFWDTFAVGGNVIKKRLQKLFKRGMNKENQQRYIQDKI